MVWNLAADYLSGAPPGGQSPLLASVKATVAADTGNAPADCPDGSTGP